MMSSTCVYVRMHVCMYAAEAVARMHALEHLQPPDHQKAECRADQPVADDRTVCTYGRIRK